MPKIAIIVPVYKVEQYIDRCVDSIMNQTYKDFELILVDDGSPDNSGKICDEYAAKHDNIVVIHKENGGPSAARNMALDWIFENSSSEYISCIDSDDWVHPEYLNYLYRAIIETGCDLSACTRVRISKFQENEPYDFSAEKISTEKFFVADREVSNVAWGKLYKRKEWEKIRFLVGKIHEDESLIYNILFRHDSIAFVNLPLYNYFENENGIMLSKLDIKRLACLEAFEEQMEFFISNSYTEAMVSTLQTFRWAAKDFIKRFEAQDEAESAELVKKKYRKFLMKYKKYYDDIDLKHDYELLYPKYSKCQKFIDKKLQHASEFIKIKR